MSADAASRHVRRGARADQLIVGAGLSAHTCAQGGGGRETGARRPARLRRAPPPSAPPRAARLYAAGEPFIPVPPPAESPGLRPCAAGSAQDLGAARCVWHAWRVWRRGGAGAAAATRRRRRLRVVPGRTTGCGGAVSRSRPTEFIDRSIKMAMTRD